MRQIESSPPLPRPGSAAQCHDSKGFAAGATFPPGAFFLYVNLVYKIGMHIAQMMDMSTDAIKSSIQIANRIMEAILAKQLAPGTRLGEQQLSELFGVSRTLVREALTRLVTRGIVTVSARRGWFVIEPSPSDAREAFEARRVIELGLLRHARPITKSAIGQLRDHINREQAAIEGDDVGAICSATSMWPCANAWATRCCRTRCATSPHAPR